MRYSSRRYAIHQALMSVHCHPTADWVYHTVRQALPNISLGTVYRNLREMASAGDISTVETMDGVMHFDADTTPHAHFVCTHCGAISDLPQPTGLDDIAQGHLVHSAKVVLYGECPSCYSQREGTLS